MLELPADAIDCIDGQLAKLPGPPQFNKQAYTWAPFLLVVCANTQRVYVPLREKMRMSGLRKEMCKSKVGAHYSW